MVDSFGFVALRIKGGEQVWCWTRTRGLALKARAEDCGQVWHAQEFIESMSYELQPCL